MRSFVNRSFAIHHHSVNAARCVAFGPLLRGYRLRIRQRRSGHLRTACRSQACLLRPTSGGERHECADQADSPAIQGAAPQALPPTKHVYRDFDNARLYFYFSRASGPMSDCCR
jgi:hypothetical protein